MNAVVTPSAIADIGPLLQVLTLSRRARAAGSGAELAFLAVNETQRGALKQELTAAPSREGDEPLVEFVDARAVAPSNDLERQDVVQAVRNAIAALPENQRMALILAKYEELPHTDIAEVLGTSEKAVKSLVHRARETLRIALAPYLQEELA